MNKLRKAAMRRILLFAGLGLWPALPAAADAEPVRIDMGTLRIENVPKAASDRFLRSASFYGYPDGQGLFAYDAITRCAANISLQNGGAPIAITDLLWNGKEYERALAAGVDLQSTEDLIAILSGRMPKNAACQERIRSAFGEGFESEARELSAVSRHSISVLKDAQIDGPDATASAAEISRTKGARERLARLIAAPEYLGAIRDGSKTLIVIGDPGSAIRWLVQYSDLGDGRWKFEGGRDAGYPVE